MSVVAKHSNNRISAKAPFQVALVEALVNPAAVFTALDESTMRLSDPDSGITVLFEGRLMEVDAEGALLLEGRLGQPLGQLPGVDRFELEVLIQSFDQSVRRRVRGSASSARSCCSWSPRGTPATRSPSGSAWR